MNITDVGHLADEVSEQGEDKMLLAAEVEGRSPKEIADYYTSAFFADIDAVGIRRADHYPKASEHIPQMIELIETLIDRGHAYVVDGNVYYDVTTFEGYGKLSGNTLSSLRSGHRGHPHDERKRNDEDFLLWRKATNRRLLKFDSPWGEGFPGWHIECSAMSLRYLGPEIDIHTGGMDLIFPHHEDEIAQSEGATGSRVVKVWVHGAHLLMGGHKMAKSKMNDIRAVDLRDRGIDPLAFRYLCLTARYRKLLNFSWEALEAAATALERLRRKFAGGDAPKEFSAEAPVESEPSRYAAEYNAAFDRAVLRDLDMPTALQILHRMADDSRLTASEKARLARAWDSVLGLGLSTDTAADSSASGDALRYEYDENRIRALIAERAAARRVRDFERADRIRADLESAGIEVIDEPSGTVWRAKKP